MTTKVGSPRESRLLLLQHDPKKDGIDLKFRSTERLSNQERKNPAGDFDRYTGALLGRVAQSFLSGSDYPNRFWTQFLSAFKGELNENPAIQSLAGLFGTQGLAKPDLIRRNPFIKNLNPQVLASTAKKLNQAYECSQIELDSADKQTRRLPGLHIGRLDENRQPEAGNKISLNKLKLLANLTSSVAKYFNPKEKPKQAQHEVPSIGKFAMNPTIGQP